MEDEKDVTDISNTEEVTPEVTEEVDSNETTQESGESVEEMRDRLEKAEALANNYKIRAEKAERKSKTEQPKTEHVERADNSLSFKDAITLSNAKVHEDDIDEIIDYAKFKKISIGEALKSSVIKASLAERSEFRQTAQATSTGKARSGASRQTAESLLKKVRTTGEIPDNADELEALVENRYKR